MENYGPLSRKRARSFESKEPETLNWIESFKVNDTFMDIGANIGIYSLYAAKRGHKVVAFEPESQNFALLQRNISLNNLDNYISLFGISLYSKLLISELNISRGKEFVEYGSSRNSFNTPTTEDGETFIPVRKQGSLGITLDYFIDNFDFKPTHIKIDVDGLEENILLGSKSLLSKKFLKSILVELSPYNKNYKNILKIFKLSGFEQIYPEVDAKEFITSSKKHKRVTCNHIFYRIKD